MSTPLATVAPVPRGALLTYDETAVALGVPRKRVRVLAHIGSLKLVDLGYRTKRVTRQSVERLLARWEGRPN